MNDLKQIQSQKTDVAFQREVRRQQLLPIEEFICSDHPKTTDGFKKFLFKKEYDKLIPANVQNYDYGKLERYAGYLDDKIDEIDHHFDLLQEAEEKHKSFCCFTDEEDKEYFNASGGKSRRKQRRDIRKEKRDEKAAAKKAWIAAGKPGGAKGWIAKKKVLKKKEKEALAVYGGAFGGRLWRGLKKYSPTMVIMRNSALALIKLNFWNLAGHIAKASELGVNNDKIHGVYLKLLTKWGQFGGNKDSLDKAINVGKGKKPLKISFAKKSVRQSKQYKAPNKFDGTEKKYFNMADKVAAALIISGGTVIATLLECLKGSGAKGVDPNLDGDVIPPPEGVSDPTDPNDNSYAGNPNDNSYEAQKAAIMGDTSLSAQEKQDALDELEDEEKDIPQWLITAAWITGAVILIAAGAFIIYKYNKKKNTIAA